MVALLYCFFVSYDCLFSDPILTVLWVGLQCVAFPGDSYLLFGLIYINVS